MRGDTLNTYPIQIDLIDLAGTRYEFARCQAVGDDDDLHSDALLPAFRAASEEAAKMHGTFQAYFEDDPERVVA